MRNINLLSFVSIIVLATLTAQAESKKPKEITLDSWSMTEDVGFYQGQSCASALRTLTKNKSYVVISADTMIDENKAHIFYTLTQQGGKGVAVIKCGEPN